MLSKLTRPIVRYMKESKIINYRTAPNAAINDPMEYDETDMIKKQAQLTAVSIFFVNFFYAR